jgi:signal peptidase I
MEIKKISKRQWISFSIWAAIVALFALWLGNAWLLLVIILLVDVYLTKYINWGAWKKSRNPFIQKVLNWIDDIIFALLAVYVINLYVFQNYQIPTSSLEKTLLIGDFLFVSKLSYGPRVPNAPIAFPLVQNTLPLFNCRSYIEWPRWGYKRVKGLGQVQRNDIVVFNFPAGDTVCLKVQNPDYYSLKYYYGEDAIVRNKDKFGEIIWRPVDKRENYVKRCVGLPGDSLQIIDNQVYIDGAPLENKRNVQFVYYVETDGSMIKEDMFRRLRVSRDDRMLVSERGQSQNGDYYHSLLSVLGFTPNQSGAYNPIYRMPLTQEAYNIIKKMPSVRRVVIEPSSVGDVYPLGFETGWSRDNYGPLWIPRKGATIALDAKNLALYERCIANYEGNRLERGTDGSIKINGTLATTYTFKYDYYWMMGDNRHCSADSRSWGFVPEDHIVGKPIMVWLSLDKDRGLFDGGIRWNRLFRFVDSFD